MDIFCVGKVEVEKKTPEGDRDGKTWGARELTARDVIAFGGWSGEVRGRVWRTTLTIRRHKCDVEVERMCSFSRRGSGNGATGFDAGRRSQ
jgi:hypothetical protein